MTLEAKDLYAALMHELKNNLGLLAMAMDRIPRLDDESHDKPLDEARLLCQQVVERLRQALLLYKTGTEGVPVQVDAYSPHESVAQIQAEAASLARDRLRIEVEVAPEVPPIWFFDRNLVDIALINAIHNSLAYARERVVIKAEVIDGMLALSVLDDSKGFPPHILDAMAQGAPLAATGTGLGLRLSQMIAQAHVNKGRIGALRLSNAPGASFSLLLP